MGRRKKGYEPVITEENQALSEEYINYIGTVYDEYLALFNGMFGSAGGDVMNETVLKTYNAIRHNGMRKLSDTDMERRHRQMRDYLFIAAKLNYLTHVQSEQKRNGTSNVEFEGYDDTEEKVLGDIWKDYQTMKILEAVEDNFEPVDFYLFRRYHLSDNMTYAKLKQETGIPNCKSRVVAINKWLRENLGKNELRKAFDSEFGQ